MLSRENSLHLVKVKNVKIHFLKNVSHLSFISFRLKIIYMKEKNIICYSKFNNEVAL